MATALEKDSQEMEFGRPYIAYKSAIQEIIFCRIEPEKQEENKWVWHFPLFDIAAFVVPGNGHSKPSFGRRRQFWEGRALLLSRQGPKPEPPCSWAHCKSSLAGTLQFFLEAAGNSEIFKFHRAVHLWNMDFRVKISSFLQICQRRIENFTGPSNRWCWSFSYVFQVFIYFFILHPCPQLECKF